MKTETASKILRRLIDLRSQVELSLSYQQGLPRAVRFHRQLESVISDLRQPTYKSPFALTIELKPRADDAEPSEGDPVS